jgi:hypothetical protein
MLGAQVDCLFAGYERGALSPERVLAQQQVARLDVPVNDAAGVGLCVVSPSGSPGFGTHLVLAAMSGS